MFSLVRDIATKTTACGEADCKLQWRKGEGFAFKNKGGRGVRICIACAEKLAETDQGFWDEKDSTAPAEAKAVTVQASAGGESRKSVPRKLDKQVADILAILRRLADVLDVDISDLTDSPPDDPKPTKTDEEKARELGEKVRRGHDPKTWNLTREEFIEVFGFDVTTEEGRRDCAPGWGELGGLFYAISRTSAVEHAQQRWREGANKIFWVEPGAAGSGPFTYIPHAEKLARDREAETFRREREAFKRRARS